MSGGLAVGIGCVLVSTTTTLELESGRWLDHIDAIVVAKPGCDYIEVELPPGARLARRWAKVSYADGGRKKLDAALWERGERALDGWASARLRTPLLSTGDRVHIKVDREHLVQGAFRWQPGRQGALFAELRIKAANADVLAFDVTEQRRGYWVDSPGPLASVTLSPPNLPTTPTPSPISAASRTPAEALAAISRRHLIPERADLPRAASLDSVITPDEVVREMIAGTGLIRALVVDDQHGDPVGEVAISTEPPVRVWAHPDQRWFEGWSVSAGQLSAAVVGAPAGDGPSANAPATVQRTLTLQVPNGSDPRTALVPGHGSQLITQERWQLRGPADRPRVRIINAAPGQTIETADLEAATRSVALMAPTRDQVLLVAAPGESPVFSLRLSQPDAPTCGGLTPPDEPPTIQAEGATVQHGDSGWWVSEWSGHPMATERARVLAALSARFDRRALPEPGLPMRLRSRLRGWDLIAELPDVLRDRVVVSPLQAVKPLWPRRLYAARASGVATPLEAALIVRAYALQAKVETDWVLVRSLGAPDGPELCASTYDAVLLRLRLDGEDRWLDLDCAACAPFEVRPELLGRPALGPWADRTPDPASGQWQVSVDGTRVTWSLQGAAALELRRQLREWPLSARKQQLATRMAGAGATLVSAKGLQERGIAVRLTADAISADRIPTALDVFSPPGGQISWPGLRIWDNSGTKRITALVKVGDTGALQAFTDR